jgi:putative ABC transport system ATP-binding protein
MKPAERKERVNEALAQVGMTDFAKRRPSQLSGGQQQCVAIARALVGRPRLLLADEPTGNLDSASGKQIMDLLREVHSRGTTICTVTHDPRFVEMADRVIDMFDGKLLPRLPV